MAKKTHDLTSEGLPSIINLNNIEMETKAQRFLPKWTIQAKRMVDTLYEKHYIYDPMVAEAMSHIPLCEFLPEDSKRSAFMDKPLFFSQGTLGPRPIAAPHMIAIMLQLLNLDTNSKVLQLGSMSGYFATLMSLIAYNGEISIVEADSTITEVTRNSLFKTGYDKKVRVINGDPLEGLPQGAPWDRIILCGSVPEIPQSLCEQLGRDSILLAPEGKLQEQELIRIQKTKGKQTIESCGRVAFVPLASKILTKVRRIESSKVSVQERAEELFKKKLPSQVPIFRKGIKIPSTIKKGIQDAFSLYDLGYYKAAIAMACVSVEGTLHCLYEQTVGEEGKEIDRWSLLKLAEKLHSIHVLRGYTKKNLDLLNELRKYSVHYKPHPIPRMDEQARIAVNSAKWFIESAFDYHRPSI